MNAHREIEIFETRAELAARAANLVVEKLSGALSLNGRASLVLSGGSTPKKLYTLLASDEYRNKVEWEKVLIFFGDERCVPPDSDESNYKTASDTLLSKVPIPGENIFRIKGELDPEIAAAEYEQQIKTTLGEHPSLDIVLLGMGPDGHTASLFPKTTALDENKKLVAANYVEKLNTWRVTLTLPAINAAKNIIFLIAGSDKAETVKEILENNSDFPAQKVTPENGLLIWLLDKKSTDSLKIKDR